MNFSRFYEKEKTERPGYAPDGINALFQSLADRHSKITCEQHDVH